jgi:hypothetical protein
MIAASFGLAHARRVVNGVRFPAGYQLLHLERSLPRRTFRSGESKVDDWLATRALQHQKKHLSVTKVLVDESGVTAGAKSFYRRSDFQELPEYP